MVQGDVDPVARAWEARTHDLLLRRRVRFLGSEGVLAVLELRLSRRRCGDVMTARRVLFDLRVQVVENRRGPESYEEGGMLVERLRVVDFDGSRLDERRKAEVVQALERHLAHGGGWDGDGLLA